MKKKLKFLKADKKGIPISELIAVHRQFSSGLKENLGDGFLLRWNPVYRNIREEFLKGGFSFTKENVAGYFSFPLMALDEILEIKKIPFRENALWLEKMERAAPGMFTLTELKRSELQMNYLFHESAHFIAHKVLFGKKTMRQLPKNADTLLKILIGESFANTAEALSASLVQGEIGSFFLDSNCHFRASEKEAGLMLNFARKNGFEATARVLFAAFLYANYMHEEITAGMHRNIESFVSVPAKIPKNLIRIGFQLSEQFRITTTQFHLVKLGFPYDLQGFMKIDPVRMIGANSKLKENVEQLIGILCKDLGRKVEFLE